MNNYFGEKQRAYSECLDKKTMEYQRKYGFELNPLKGHRTWNVEADAFKHAFMGADLAFDYGNLGSFTLGVFHETQPKNNPPGEWNMDSWNNNQGREVAKEILKEYGKQVYKMSDKQRSDLIAEKIMKKMRSGELITKPDDSRKYNGKLENIINEIKNRWDGNLTGQAAQVEPFTREDIGSMSSDEFSKNERAIMAKLKEYGIPSEKDLPNGQKSNFHKEKSKSSKDNGSSDGKWVTINGNHVLIKD